jgi:outer membrane protein OmpA-like peptidoglycan-associated protein
MRKNVFGASCRWVVGLLIFFGARVTASAQYFVHYATAARHLPSNQVNCLLVDQARNLWVGTDKGLAKFSTADSAWQTVDLPALGQITALALDSEGQVWASGYLQSVKLVQLDANGQILFMSEVPNFQNKNLHVNGLAVDKKGRKWLATDEGGIWMIDQNNKWFCYDQSTQPDMPTNKITSLVIDETDTKWFGTEMGLLSTEEGTDWPLYYVEGAVNASAADGAGTVCVGVVNRKGRSEMYCNKDVYKLLGQPQKGSAFKISAILMEGAGVVWAVGTGIARYAKSSKEVFDLDNSGLTSNLATSIVKSSLRSGEKVFWIGTADQGLFLLRFTPPPVVAAPELEPVVARVETKELDLAKAVALPAGNQPKPVLKTVEVVALPETKPEPEREVEPQPKPEPAPEETKPAPKVEALTLNDQKIKAGETISLEKLSFVKGSARLTDYIGADVLVKFMQAHPNVEIELAGHTDKNPDPWHPEYERISRQHYELSKQRVETVSNYLIKNGIAPERIKTQAFGGEKPVVNKSSEKNMRVDLKLLKVN